MNIATTSRSITILSILLLLITGWGVWSLRTAVKNTQLVEEEKTILQTLAIELQRTSEELTQNVRYFAATSDERYIKKYNEILEERAGKRPRAHTRFVQPGEKIALLELLKQNGCNEEELAILAKATELSNNLAKIEMRAIDLIKAGQQKDALELLFSKEYESWQNKIAKPIEQFDSQLIARITLLIENATNDMLKYLTIVTIAIIINIAVALSNGLFTDIKVLRRLLICSNYANDLADGKYEPRLYPKTNDEIGAMVDTLNIMVDSLQERIKDATAATENAKEKQSQAEIAMKDADTARKQAERAKRDGMLQAAEQLSAVVEAVSTVSHNLNSYVEKSDQGAKDQAHLALETAGSMDEMKEAVNAVAKSASDASSAAGGVRAKAQEGVRQVGQVTQSMAELSAASAKISDDMHSLGEHADGIGAILSTISDIADQTNLLALNAAIEAARAGEAGRGFAVVADEVRKLAEKTMSATHEVRQAISTIQESVKINIVSVTQTGEMSQNVTEIVQRSGEVLDEILRLAEASADQVQSIATAAEEQSASGEHISRSVDTISTIANETAATMQESADAVTELMSQTEKLSNLIEEMKKA